MIQKGSREPVIGCKPQRVRSEYGFVTSLMVPEGNAADASMLVSAITDAMEHTDVIADIMENSVVGEFCLTS